MNQPELIFYTQPFHEADYTGWVWDAKGNFVFQFEDTFDERGNLPAGYEELKQQVVDSLNSTELKPIQGLNLSLRRGFDILNNGEEFITIRGWGGLTGIGGHNLDADTAAKIQDDFSVWIFYKLTG